MTYPHHSGLMRKREKKAKGKKGEKKEKKGDRLLFPYEIGKLWGQALPLRKDIFRTLATMAFPQIRPKKK